MPISTRRRRGGRRQRNPPVDATQAPVPEPELPGRTGYVPAPLRLPDALTSTPSAAPRAPAARPAWMPRVRRTAAERAARLRLPACGAEQEIVDAVRGADVVVLSGATGSGKSTQVPQFLYEAGLCGPRGLRVVATQPRRVAVVATAERVARELGAADPGAARDALVAYRTRYDRGGLGPATRLVFETDGVLLRELERDLLLRDYGAAVVDEAHERSLTTDLLLGLLGRSVALRRAEFERARAAGEPDVLAPLKVVVMSATLDARALSRRELWPAPPRLVELEGRQHPVSVHFARETVLEDYAGAALEVVRRVHREAADDGAILVFLTGRREIEAFCGELRSDRTLDVRPLYAQMALEAQREAFAPTRAGRARKVVVATDVAETSLTIPGARPASGRRRLRPTARPPAGVVHVVDCGRAKRQVVVDAASGAVAHRVGWISRANADQRSGRAGRTRPGHCHRLYSSAVYAETFEASEKPELLRLPVVDVVLRVKALGVRDPSAFPFPDRPPPASVEAACESLARLGALELRRPYARAPLSELGRALASLPVGARHAATLAYAGRVAKGLAAAKRDAFAALAVACVAAASERSPFRDGAAEGERRAFRHPLGDAHARLLALGAYAAAADRAACCAARGLDEGALGRAVPSPASRARGRQPTARRLRRAGAPLRVAPPVLRQGRRLRRRPRPRGPRAGVGRRRRAPRPVPRGRRPRPGRAARGARSGRRGGAAGRRVAGRALGPAVARRVPPGLRLRAARRRRLLLRPPGLRGARADARRPAGVCRVRDRLLGERSPAPRGRDRGRGTAPGPARARLRRAGRAVRVAGADARGRRRARVPPRGADATRRGVGAAARARPRRPTRRRRADATVAQVSAALDAFSEEDAADVCARVALARFGGDDLLEPRERTVPLDGAAPTARGLALRRALRGVGDGGLVGALRGGGARAAFLACVRPSRRAAAAERLDAPAE